MLKIKKITNFFSCFFVTSFTLVSCFPNQNSKQEYKILANYNGQADILLSLQITPDYFPYQYNENELRDYIVNPQKYIIVNEKTSNDKKAIKEKFKNRLNSLTSRVREFGPSLWNNAIYNEGQVERNLEFWTNKKVNLFFLERFVLDDHKDNEVLQYLPSFEYQIQSNFRASRDPYTVFSNKVFENFYKDQNSQNFEKIATELNKYYNTFPNGKDPDALYRYGSYIKFWNDKIEAKKTLLQQKGYFDWIKNQDYEQKFTPLFYPGNMEYDKLLSKQYAKLIVDNEQSNKLKAWNNNQDWTTNYYEIRSKVEDSTNKISNKTNEDNSLTNANKKTILHNHKTKILQHHPAFEQQPNPGSSPAAEGSQRDNMVYLFQLVSGIDDYVKNNSQHFTSTFQNDVRYLFLQNALNSAKAISDNMKTRLKNIRDYFKAIKVVDSNYDPENYKFQNDNSKTFAIVTIPPGQGGGGNATIQTISKFAFIYSDIGLKQVLPTKDNKIKELDYEKADSVKYAGYGDDNNKGNNELNLDDNGWWWNLGDSTNNTTNLNLFKATADTLFITANDEDWNSTDQSVKEQYETILKTSISTNDTKTNNKNKSVKVSYRLWNEGLRSPFSLNMVLDQLVAQFQNQYDSSWSKTEEYKKAMDWGNYWSDNFINAKHLPEKTS